MPALWKALLIYAVAVASAAILLGAVLFVFNGDRVDEINDERAANIERNCLDVNRRHDNTLAALDRLLERPGVSPEQRAQARASTVLLIEALVPRRDCQKLAARQVSP